MEDLKRLYLDGIVACVDGEERSFFGGLLAFLADNMQAAHAVGGFKESLSFALRICRTCFVTTELAQECYIESNCCLRTPEGHAKQCNLQYGPLIILRYLELIGPLFRKKCQAFLLWMGFCMISCMIYSREWYPLN